MGALNVKPDDLARIVNCPEVAHCIVRVDRALSAGEAMTQQVAAPAWECTALCEMRGSHGRFVPAGGSVNVADCILRPLPGLPADDSADVVHELPLDVYGEPA